jgi:hypothetical protein
MIQEKLENSRTGDRFEKQADIMAESIKRQPEEEETLQRQPVEEEEAMVQKQEEEKEQIQRQPAEEEEAEVQAQPEKEETEPNMAKAGSNKRPSSDPPIASKISRLRKTEPKQPISVRTFFEPRVWGEPNLLSESLNKISLGKALWLISQREGINGFDLAFNYLNEAVAGLRKSGSLHSLPIGLLSRAAISRSQKKFDESWADLNEAHEIAIPGNMNLFLSDYHIEATRLLIAQNKNYDINGKIINSENYLIKAKDHFKSAEELVNRVGYHIRGKELKELKKELFPQ